MEKSRIVNQYIRDIRRNIPEVIVVAVERNGGDPYSRRKFNLVIRGLCGDFRQT